MAVMFFSTLLLPFAKPSEAQETGVTLSGNITSAAGAPIAGAKLTARSLTTAQTTETLTDAGGNFSLPNLSPGEYELTATAAGYVVQTVKAALSAGGRQTENFTMTSAEGAAGPSLSDLGFATGETQGSEEQQKRLDKRAHMLKMHQRLGLITTVPLIATVILGANAGGKSTSSASRDAHVALGAVTGDLYGITAYYAIFAPKIEGTQTHGPIRLHKTLAWIHGPGMIMTAILGALAYNQKNNGEKVHGIASAHGPVAIVTASAYGLAMLSMTLKF